MLEFDRISLLVATADVSLPPLSIASITKAREWLVKSAEEMGEILDQKALRSLAPILIRHYATGLAAMQNSASQQIRNMDGDIIAPVRIIYSHTAESVSALANLIEGRLNRGADQPGFQVTAQDSSGAPLEIIIPLSGPPKNKTACENVIIGSLSITTEEAVLTANSDERSERLQSMIDEQFSDLLTFECDEVISMEEGMRPPVAHGFAKGDAPPEVVAALKAHMAAQQEKWLVQPVPALGNMTPQEAAKDPQGRILLEALLDDFDSRSKAIQSDRWAAGFDVKELRARLGFDTGD